MGIIQVISFIKETMQKLKPFWKKYSKYSYIKILPNRIRSQLKQKKFY